MCNPDSSTVKEKYSTSGSTLLTTKKGGVLDVSSYEKKEERKARVNVSSYLALVGECFSKEGKGLPVVVT